MNYTLQFGPIWDNRALIIDGFITTILLSAVALVLATLIGIAVGTAATAQGRTFRAVSVTYVESMRNIPLLIHMYFWYNGLSFLKIPAFWCGVFGLSLYSGAYVAEIVRSGILAVATGQWEAGGALGLSRGVVLRRIVLPQLDRGPDGGNESQVARQPSGAFDREQIHDRVDGEARREAKCRLDPGERCAAANDVQRYAIRQSMRGDAQRDAGAGSRWIGNARGVEIEGRSAR